LASRELPHRPGAEPCRFVAAHLAELAGERDNLRIAKLNVDENPHLANLYGILAIPLLILFETDRRYIESPARNRRAGYCRRLRRRWRRRPDQSGITSWACLMLIRTADPAYLAMWSSGERDARAALLNLTTCRR
jgi:thioredoxin family protein